MCHHPACAGRHDKTRRFTWRKKRDVVVMICDLMAVTMIGMHQVNDVFVGVAMFFDLGMMFRDDLCQFGEIMSDRTRVRGQEHTNRQSDGQQSSQVSRNMPCHSTCSRRSWPTRLDWHLFKSKKEFRQSNKIKCRMSVDLPALPCVIQLGILRIIVAYSSRVKSGRRSLFSPRFTNSGTFLCAIKPRATASSNTRFMAELCVLSVLALGSRPIFARRHS